MERQGVFISYSKKDSKWLKHLKPHLNYLEQDYEFSIWEDSKIAVGANWREEIQTALNSAKVAILMISANFLSSNFIKEEELPSLLMAARNEGALIFPIIVSPCMFHDIDSISKFQTINSPSEPLISMNKANREALFHKVTKEIKQVLSSSPNKGKKPKRVKVNNPLDVYKLSFRRIHILKTFIDKKEEIGLSITQVREFSNINNRKDVVFVIQEMVKLKIIQKIDVGKNAFFRVTKIGETLLESYI